jgi:hypothetical protein
MIARLRVLAMTLALSSLLGHAASVAEAQQFYNPWTYHHTRQQYSNRAVARSISRKHRARRKTSRRTTQRRAVASSRSTTRSRQARSTR